MHICTLLISETKNYLYHDTVLLKCLFNAFPGLQGLPPPYTYTFSEYDEANYFSLK